MRKIGNFRYATFGLRKEWIEQFFQQGLDVLNYSFLGPRQKDALYYYLKDIELILNRKEETVLFEKMFLLYINRGINSLDLWSFLWVNLYFNSLLFSWYGTLPLGCFERRKTIDLMAKDYGKKNRSIANGYASLVSAFEKTPIGTDLKIGRVVKEGRARAIYKEGGFNFNPIVILYALYKYAEKNHHYNIDLGMLENEIYSPQKIFVIDINQVKHAVLSLYELDFYSVEIAENENKMMVMLNSMKKPLDVIELFLKREEIR
jgi:phosphoadenosine phosphosulfate reductase